MEREFIQRYLDHWLNKSENQLKYFVYRNQQIKQLRTILKKIEMIINKIKLEP